MKKVLIISYKFPPTPGIGGRRWAKFAKYLYRVGIDIHVIKIKDNISCSENSLWSKDVEEFENRISFVNNNYPTVLSRAPNNLLGKILYRLSLQYVKLFSYGNYHDRTSLLKKKIFLALENKINEGYNNIIVTGAPFNLPYYVSLVKKQYPYINIISDFRDTWFKGKPYGFEAMSQKRINEEKSKQINILKFSDSITVPSVQMKSDLQNEFPSQKDKIIHLPHGYDVDEFESKTTESNKNSLNKKIKVIFGGAIYDNLEEHFCNLQKFIDHYKSKVSFEFYTDDVKKIPVALRNNINIHKPLPTALFFKKVKAGDFYLALREDQHKNYISTKFYEIIFLRKPIIFVGEKGLISNLIESNRLGISTTPKELFLKLEKIVKAPKSINYNYNFPVNNYSYTKITEKLLGLIN